jgi:hypothetical protein
MNPRESGRKGGMSDGMRKEGVWNSKEGAEERNQKDTPKKEIGHFFLDTGRVFCYSFSLITFD